MIHWQGRLACIGGVKCMVPSNAGKQSIFLQLGGVFFPFFQMKFSKSFCWPPGVKFSSGHSEARTAVDFVYAKSQPFWLSAQFFFHWHHFDTCIPFDPQWYCSSHLLTLSDVWSTHLPPFSSQLTIWFSVMLFPPVLYVTNSVWEGVKDWRKTRLTAVGKATEVYFQLLLCCR